MDSYGTGIEDCYSCVNSTGKKDDSSYENQTPGKWCCSLNISTFHEEFFSCYNNDRNMYCYICKDGKKGRYVNNLECTRSGEDYSSFEDRDRGIPCKFCENVFDNENCTNYFSRNIDKKIVTKFAHKKNCPSNSIGVSWQLRIRNRKIIQTIKDKLFRANLFIVAGVLRNSANWLSFIMMNSLCIGNSYKSRTF